MADPGLPTTEARTEQTERTDESDLLLHGSRGDGLTDGPVDGLDQPGVAGEPNFLGPLVDAFYEFIRQPERDLLHAGMVSDLTSDIRSDIILLVRQDNYTEVARKQQTGRLARAWNTAPTNPARGSAIGMTLGDEIPTRKGTHRPAPRERTRSTEPGGPVEVGPTSLTSPSEDDMDEFCFCGTCGECIWEQESFEEAAEAERRYERHLETNEQYRDEVFADIHRAALGGF